jgi:hypothetical protein
MATFKDSFTIDIALRHPSYRPDEISKALSIEPQASWAAGHRLDKLRTQGTFFHACLQRGDSPEGYEAALAEVVLRRFLGTIRPGSSEVVQARNGI